MTPNKLPSVSRLKMALDKRMAAIAKQRDLLDDYISEAEELREHLIEALDDLQRARDAMSRFV